MNSLFYKKVCFIILTIFFLHDFALAKDPRLINIIVTQPGDELLLYLNVEGAFTEEVEEAILSGIPTTFSFFIKLFQPRKLWFNKKISDLKIDITVKYSNLKKEFVVTRSWEVQKPLATQSLKEARTMMEKIEGLKIIKLSKLEKGRNYQIKAKAKLSKITLPFYLHNIFFFVSLWDFETDWYTIKFSY
jgi:hypothetical protein